MIGLDRREIRHAHFFCGLGGGARGFNMGEARVGNMVASFRCIGGIDVDAPSIRDFERLAGVPGTVMDLFNREQFIAFHGREPGPDWREATTADIHRAFGHERPHIVFLSAPCKGFSGLLAEKTSLTDKYQALNELTLRGVFLMLEAYADDPPELIIFENVPRIMSRGRTLLDRIQGLLRGYGYAVAETKHNCGEIGGLAQSRERFLMVARHEKKVPHFLYEPPKHRLRGVGEVLDLMPLPGDPRGGPMHRVPALQWKTWVRLAFVEAGKDWRCLNELRVEDGMLADWVLVPERSWQDGVMGVLPWAGSSGVIKAKAEVTTGRHAIADPRAFSSREGSGFLGVKGYTDYVGVISGNGRPGAGAYALADPRPGDRRSGALGVLRYSGPAGTVAGESLPPNGAFALADPRGTKSQDYRCYGVLAYSQFMGVVTGARSPGQGFFALADPRVDGHPESVQLGVRPWTKPAAVVKGDVSVGTGPYALADPRILDRTPFSNVFRIVPYEGATMAVTSAQGAMAAVADPRMPTVGYQKTKYQVTPMDAASRTVIGASTTGDGAFALADPRTGFGPNSHRNKLKVVDYKSFSPTATGSDRVGSGALSVGDPRPASLKPDRKVFLTQGHYGVVPWKGSTGSVTAFGQSDNGRWAVADTRLAQITALPEPAEQLVCVIIARDGTWHRPFTTLELAALQSLFDPEEAFYVDPRVRAEADAFDASNEAVVRERGLGFLLDGKSDSAWRERIGNAVPSKAAKAIADVMGRTLLLSWSGETFALSNDAIWVSPLEIALAVNSAGQIPAEVY